MTSQDALEPLRSPKGTGLRAELQKQAVGWLLIWGGNGLKSTCRVKAVAGCGKHIPPLTADSLSCPLQQAAPCLSWHSFMGAPGQPAGALFRDGQVGTQGMTQLLSSRASPEWMLFALGSLGGCTVPHCVLRCIQPFVFPLSEAQEVSCCRLHVSHVKESQVSSKQNKTKQNFALSLSCLESDSPAPLGTGPLGTPVCSVQ